MNQFEKNAVSTYNPYEPLRRYEHSNVRTLKSLSLNLLHTARTGRKKKAALKSRPTAYTTSK
jgi:hypothetical protein